MKKILAMLMMLCSSAFATETIKIMSPYSASHSGTTAMNRIIEEANKSQHIYTFVLEFRPGGNQLIALKAMDSNSLGIIAAAFVDNINSGKVVESDYVPIHTIGNACWVVVTNGAVNANKELVVGTVGFGNATHLTALSIADKYKLDVKYIGFKSNNDAFMNMAGNHGVTLGIDRYELYESLKDKNSKLQLFAASCPVRIPSVPKLKTLQEIGIEAPYVFNITVAPKSMDETRRKAIAIILNDAQNKIGSEEILKISGMKIPSGSAEQFYTRSVSTVRKFQQKYISQIQEAK